MIKRVEDDDSVLYDVSDLDTNKKILLVQYANDITGEYEVFSRDEKGNIDWKNKILKKGNIKLVKKEEK